MFPIVIQAGAYERAISAASVLMSENPLPLREGKLRRSVRRTQERTSAKLAENPEYFRARGPVRSTM